MDAIEIELLPPDQNQGPDQPLQFQCKACKETMTNDLVDQHAYAKHRIDSYSVDTATAARRSAWTN